MSLSYNTTADVWGFKYQTLPGIIVDINNVNTNAEGVLMHMSHIIRLRNFLHVFPVNVTYHIAHMTTV